MTISFIFTTITVLLLFLSLLANGVLFFYSRSVFSKIYVASEEASKVFTMIDSYESHLRSVYELPSFYGDETLSSLLEHTKDMSGFLKQYEEVYSFTQPDLLEQLKEVEEKMEEQDGNQEKTA